MALMSMRQYAKHRGVSVEAVSKAVRQGRISCTREGRSAFIDPEVADREWDGNSDPNKVIASNMAKPDAEPPSEDPGKGPSLHKSSAVLKAYQARLAKLEFDEKSGKLHDVDQCKRDAFNAARSVRDSLLGIPDRLSAELAGETDQFTIRQRLDAEIRQALESLAGLLVSGG